jgi:hypothetical protein
MVMARGAPLGIRDEFVTAAGEVVSFAAQGDDLGVFGNRGGGIGSNLQEEDQVPIVIAGVEKVDCHDLVPGGGYSD